MKQWKDEMDSALRAFGTVAELAGCSLPDDEPTREDLPAPHRPRSMPAGMMAVYCFWGNGEWLKIGKAGPKSNARYVSQHYGKNRALSSLAGSLCADSRMSTVPSFDPENPGEWIKASTHRVNLLLPAGRHASVLSLLEAFLHARLRPRYEG